MLLGKGAIACFSLSLNIQETSSLTLVSAGTNQTSPASPLAAVEAEAVATEDEDGDQRIRTLLVGGLGVAIVYFIICAAIGIRMMRYVPKGVPQTESSPTTLIDVKVKDARGATQDNDAKLVAASRKKEPDKTVNKANKTNATTAKHVRDDPMNETDKQKHFAHAKEHIRPNVQDQPSVSNDMLDLAGDRAEFYDSSILAVPLFDDDDEFIKEKKVKIIHTNADGKVASTDGMLSEDVSEFKVTKSESRDDPSTVISPMTNERDYALRGATEAGHEREIEDKKRKHLHDADDMAENKDEHKHESENVNTSKETPDETSEKFAAHKHHENVEHKMRAGLPTSEQTYPSPDAHVENNDTQWHNLDLKSHHMFDKPDVVEDQLGTKTPTITMDDFKPDEKYHKKSPEPAENEKHYAEQSRMGHHTEQPEMQDHTEQPVIQNKGLAMFLKRKDTYATDTKEPSIAPNLLTNVNQRLPKSKQLSFTDRVSQKVKDIATAVSTTAAKIPEKIKSELSEIQQNVSHLNSRELDIYIKDAAAGTTAYIGSLTRSTEGQNMNAELDANSKQQKDNTNL